MAIPGHVDYKKREFCNDVKCPVQLLLNGQEEGSEQYEKIRGICKDNCVFSAHGFHQWLIDRGYLVVRPENSQTA